MRSEDYLPSKFFALITIAIVATAFCRTPLVRSGESAEFLYIENPDGALSTYKIEPSGALTLTGTLRAERQAALPFAHPDTVSLAIQPGGKFAYSTDPFQGGVSFIMLCYTVDQDDGRLLPNPAACVPPVTIQGVLTMSPEGRVLYVSHYDQAIYPYAIDQAAGKVSKVASKVDSGMLEVPVLTPSGNLAYVLHRRANNITSYKVATDDSMRLVSGINGVPTGNKPSHMVIDPSGNFAYAVNSSDDTISEYFIDPRTGALRINPKTPTIGTGSVPNAIAIDGSGQFLYCANSNGQSISRYRIGSDGSLTLIGVTEASGIGVGFIMTDAAGKLLYHPIWAGRQDCRIIGYRITSDGQLVGRLSEPIQVFGNPPGYAPAMSWTGSKPTVEIVKRDVTPLMRMKTSIAGTFTETGPMKPPSYQRWIGGTLLPDGRVVLPESDGYQNLYAEVYDPRSEKFTSMGMVSK